MLVVLERDALPLDTLFFISLLLQSEHMLVELLLELLVCIVDAELFKRIFLKDFKAKDVE